MKTDKKRISAIFFDIDGTLIHQQRRINGADEAVSFVRRMNLNVRFLTNITRCPPVQIAQHLRSLGIDASENEVFSAPTACTRYLKQQHYQRIRLLMPEETRPLFSELPIDRHNPDVIVIGDVTERFDFHLINEIYGQIEAGADMIAMSRNPFWFNQHKKQLDIGAYVNMLEKVTNKTALICGKPESMMFSMALKSANVTAKHVLMVGDDVSTDIQGANRAGLNACLVGTGKYRPGHEMHVPETHFLPSVAHLPHFLSKICHFNHP